MIAGCGASSSDGPSSHELALERSQLQAIAGELRAAQRPVERELSAARVAWPAISNGLARSIRPSLTREVGEAATRAAMLAEPAFIAQAATLTGPAAGISGLYETFIRLAARGWRMTAATLSAIDSGTSAQAKFARANAPLYIDAVYDSHFDLSLLGKSVLDAYRTLGGPSAFGDALTQSEVDALAAAYSIEAVRLEPHPGKAAEAR